jgi:hypothetical protein
MSEPLSCAEAQDLAAEVALGIADARDRARLMTHVATCAGCRRLLMDVSETVDAVVVLAPEQQPPPGFESRVLSRLHGQPGDHAPGRIAAGPRAGRPPRTIRRVMLGAAALVLAAVLAGAAVYWVDKPDRELASSVRRTLAIAHGQYFTAFPLLDAAGTTSGSLFAYQGQPAWVFLTVEPPPPPGRYTVEITDRDGVRHVLAAGMDLSRAPSWGFTIPVAVHESTVLRVIGAGQVVYSARLGPG